MKIDQKGIDLIIKWEGQPFLISDDRKYISFPSIITGGKTMNYGEFTVNGKFNDGFELT